jgi:hypothetical protein
LGSIFDEKVDLEDNKPVLLQIFVISSEPEFFYNDRFTLDHLSLYKEFISAVTFTMGWR